MPRKATSSTTANSPSSPFPSLRPGAKLPHYDGKLACQLAANVDGYTSIGRHWSQKVPDALSFRCYFETGNNGKGATVLALRSESTDGTTELWVVEQVYETVLSGPDRPEQKIGLGRTSQLKVSRSSHPIFSIFDRFLPVR
jgi:hypothetical protein